MGHIISKEKDYSEPKANSFVTYYLETNLLSRVTFNLLDELQIASASIYNRIIATFSEIVDKDKPQDDILYIKPCHFDIVSEFFQLQRSLPENAEKVLNNYLEERNFHIGEIIQGLRVSKLVDVAKQELGQNLSHHTTMHGNELKVKAMQVINFDLMLFNSNSKYDICMRNPSYAFFMDNSQLV